MRKLTLVLFVIVLAVLAGGAYLATWEIPPPTTAVEKVLPDERFPR